jgi:Protease inhibitor Inh
MRILSIASCVAGAVLFTTASLAVAVAEDNEAGVPLTPKEAAGAWTVSSGGQDLCVLNLGAAHTVKAASGCGDALASAPTAWQATHDGMQLMSGGQPVLAFHRWSNSLFVSHRASGVDIQLRRNY